MRFWTRNRLPGNGLRADRALTPWLALMLASATTFAQHPAAPAEPALGSDTRLPAPPNWPSYIIPGAPESSTLYHDGSRIVIDSEERWKLVCGSNAAGQTPEDLRRYALQHAAIMAQDPVVIVDLSTPTRGLNITFSAGGSVPAAALTALGLVEAYLEPLFGDPITVSISVSFQDLGGGGIIGATSSFYVSNVSYTNSRNGLINGMDADDIIQSWLPTGSTLPVRYNGGSSTVTNEGYIDWTRANYRATVGTVSGSAASMTFNTQMAFDYDPSNGVSLGTISFVDVAIHETGHALGFTSGADITISNQTEALDVYRFQRSDGTGDYNPDTYQEFQVRPRLVDYNVPNDDVNSDLIDYEHRMSDGDPYQASHFREQIAWIGLMDPAFAFGETHYPNYFSSADKHMFDAIGWDHPPCTTPQFTQQPANQNACTGAVVSLSVAVNIPSPVYQWRKGLTDLHDDGVHIFGATTAMLILANVTQADIGDYSCHVTDQTGACAATSNSALILVYLPITYAQQPVSQTVSPGGSASFSVVVSGNPQPTGYQWRKNGLPLSNGGNISGATTAMLTINPVQPPDAGSYDVVATNPCGSVPSQAATLTVGAGLLGDLNCDGVLNAFDIDPFVLALTDPTGYAAAWPNCNRMLADCNGDGVVNAFDIDPFVDLLTP